MLLQCIKAGPFDDERIAILRKVPRCPGGTVDDAVALLGAFSFDDGRLKAVDDLPGPFSYADIPRLLATMVFDGARLALLDRLLTSNPLASPTVADVTGIVETFVFSASRLDALQRLGSAISTNEERERVVAELDWPPKQTRRAREVIGLPPPAVDATATTTTTTPPALLIDGGITISGTGTITVGGQTVERNADGSYTVTCIARNRGGLFNFA
jgi:hypothetical protein